MKLKYWHAVVVMLSLLVVGTQPALGTRYIPTDTSIGDWDEINRIYTLTADVSETIQIDEDNLTLDGAGHTVSGAGTGNGINLGGRTEVTVKNISVEGFYRGIFLNESNNNTVTGSFTNNHTGILVLNSSSNILTGNTASNNATGIYLHNGCTANTVAGNTTLNNTAGIVLRNSSNNTLSGNTTSYNQFGIQVFGTNSIYSDGLFSRHNTLRDNTVSYNDPYGLVLGFDSSDSTIFNNNFIENYLQISVDASSTGNLFNMDKPTGGNYWSDHMDPDANGDGIVDVPYAFSGGPDNLPWTQADGWLVRTPQEQIAQIIVDVLDLNLQQGIENGLDVKLDAASRALDDLSEHNDVAAINALQAFINAVQAQSDSKIPQADAAALIAKAQKIIDCLRRS